MPADSVRDGRMAVPASAVVFGGHRHPRPCPVRDSCVHPDDTSPMPAHGCPCIGGLLGGRTQLTRVRVRLHTAPWPMSVPQAYAPAGTIPEGRPAIYFIVKVLIFFPVIQPVLYLLKTRGTVPLRETVPVPGPEPAKYRRIRGIYRSP